MSSAILYAAIVAIWAGVLIPRWLKRDHSHAAVLSAEAAGEQRAGAGTEAQADGAETMTGNTAGRSAETERATAGGDGTTRVAAHEASAAGHAGRTGRRGSQAGGYDAGRAENRPRIVVARRRMLLILVTLTLAAVGIVGLKLAAWWVAVPPVLMLGGYLILLREAGRADRERALLAAAARDEERERYEQEAPQPAAEAPAPVVSPTARVIDISGRVRDEDEIYDQYADGTRRAVGD